MAQTIDLKAKQRKQIIVLAVGGVLLLGLMLIQLPKLMNSGSAPAAASAEAEPATGATGETGATATPGTTAPASAGTTGATSTAVASGPTAVVAGVTIAGGAGVASAEGQLWSFSRFPTKDPFVPQVTEDGGAVTPGSEARVPPPIDKSFTQPGGGKAATAGSAGSSDATTGNGAGGASTPAFATIQVNGKAEQLEPKQAFPAAEPTFVLVGLTKGGAKIGVKGGAFTNGSTVTLERGKPVTLMDTATGARYVMKLVFLGAQPEQIESFSTSPGGSKPKK